MDLDPLEQQLQRALRAHDVPLPVPDPVHSVRVGMRRIRRLRRLAVLSAGVASSAVVMAAALLTLGPSDQPRPAPGSTQAPVAAEVPAAVPPGFRVTDLSFVSADRGWVLGTAPCGRKQCTSLLVTADGGASWSRRTTPPAATAIRFASDSDGSVGYASGADLAITTDGGRSWTPQRSTDLYGLEPSGEDVLRLVVEPSCTPPGCRFRVQRSALGSLVWSTVSAPVGLAADASLVRHGDDAAVMLFGSRGSGPTTLLLTEDAGATWTERGDPCRPVGSTDPAASSARALSLGPDATLVVLCRKPSTAGPQTSVTVSDDGGRAFGPLRPLPVSRDGVAVAVSGAQTFVVAIHPTGKGNAEVLRTSDSGRTWNRVADQQLPDRLSPELLRFTGSQVGLWVGHDATRTWRTTDGGLTWKAHPLR